jgi:hypothetical protein
MTNTAGAYIIVLIFANFNQGGVAMQEFANYDSCKAAEAQIEKLNDSLYAYCVAKDVK